MGDIKSTLDLIMEKTKNMTITDEEKAQIRRSEWSGKVARWIHAYLDRRIDADTIRKEITAAGQEHLRELTTLFTEEILRTIDPEGDITKPLALLEEICGIDPSPIVRLVAQFQDDVGKKQEQMLQNARDTLSSRGISGSAVVPTISGDDEWQAVYQHLREGFTDRLLATAGSYTTFF